HERFRGVLLHSEPHDPFDRRVGYRTIQRKSQIPLWPGVPFERPLQRRVATHRREKTDMIRKRREIHENAALLERRHAVADPLLGFGCRGAYDAPDLAQYRAHARWRGRDVLVD